MKYTKIDDFGAGCFGTILIAIAIPAILYFVAYL
jgi:hypothetical protein